MKRTTIAVAALASLTFVHLCWATGRAVGAYWRELRDTP